MKFNMTKTPMVMAFVLVFVLLCLPAAWATNHDDDIATIQKASKAFTQVAKKAIPIMKILFRRMPPFNIDTFTNQPLLSVYP